MPCHNCGRIQTDPTPGSSPWARGVTHGEQILLCPDCQEGHPHLVETLDRCRRCGSTRMSVMLGDVVCRACGEDNSAPRPIL